MEKIRSLIHLPSFNKDGFSGKNIGIAVLDTGINALHQDFSNQSFLYFRDYVKNQRVPYDDNGHGTHVCGILAGNGKKSKGKYRGIAPDARLFVYKTLDRAGNGYTKNSMEALKDIRTCYKEKNIRLLNFSVGFLSSANEREIRQLLSMIDELWDLGICVIAAAGNNGPGAQTVTAPGISRKVITVGACKACEENHFMAENYSGVGPTGCCIVKPEVYVPGTNIVSASNVLSQYVKRSGTSMATPIVCGAIALLLEANPALTPNQIKLLLYQTCIKDKGTAHNRGWGVLHVEKLIEAGKRI